MSIYSTLKEDVYLILVGYNQGGQNAKFQLFINPLINWVWIGGILMIFGSVWAMWPTARDRRLAHLERGIALESLSVLSDRTQDRNLV